MIPGFKLVPDAYWITAANAPPAAIEAGAVNAPKTQPADSVPVTMLVFAAQSVPLGVPVAPMVSIADLPSGFQRRR